MISINNDYNDIADLISGEAIPFRGAEHGNERSCYNCTMHDTCFPVDQASLMNLYLPNGFTPRAGWDENRIERHLRSVYGQICGFFSHTQVNLRSHFRQAELSRRRELGIRGEWDAEEN